MTKKHEILIKYFIIHIAVVEKNRDTFCKMWYNVIINKIFIILQVAVTMWLLNAAYI